MTDWSKLLPESEFNSELRERKKTYLEKTIWKITLENEEQEGWQYYSETKNPDKIKVRKDKPSDEVFENRLWVLFATMGFHTLNKDRHFTIDYSKGGDSLSKQIDVFAVDDETALVVECKCAESLKSKSWKTDLEAIKGYMDPASKEIKKKFPKRNIKFIFATCNYSVGEQDRNRMKDFGIAYFDEKTISYYEELVKHLGTAARYQLLGSLFAGKKIAGMDIKIPAIQGKMGGYTYYSFSIQPETLLKIGYVLHRSEANNALMPTYQRIIKKPRLVAIHKFIENHGFFPNSIIISIETPNGKPPQFDLSNLQGTDDVTRMGLLHLPNTYRSAYIIDGQHRLYGYSDSQYATTNSIPVVAFVNMDQKEQVKLFMEINENQKAVSKTLRNTLNADLLWVSSVPSEKRTAIQSRVAQDLGDSMDSPLYNRVVIGEDQGDEIRCITLQNIVLAIGRTNMLTKFAKDQTPTEHGIFDLDDNEKTTALIEKYLFGCFAYLKEIMPEEWEKNPKTDGMLLFNNAVGGLILLFGDIANELKDKGYDIRQMDEFLEETHYYLDPIETYINNLSDEDRNEIRSYYGTSGPTFYWRHMQRAIHEAHPEFLPDGYINYWEDHGKSYNAESTQIMEKTEKAVREFVRKTITEHCEANNSNWIQSIPKKVYTEAQNGVSKAEYETGNKQDVWDFINMSGFQNIVTYGDNWSSMFEKAMTLPSETKKAGGKKAKTEWIMLIDKLQKSAGRSSFSVAKSDYEVLKEVETILPRFNI